MPTEYFIIRLYVAKKYYPLNCKRVEEGIYRKAATNINEKIIKYSSAFPAAELGTEDLLAMAAVDIAVENIKIKQKQDLSPVFDKIEALDKELEEYLKAI
ncbi:MAG: cell division protein ZapA [Dysgonamonadaceae bacterium]|jgi:cell division protein ZapA|nr:cell division protein ZapA [Dysgonamonadaceae bacterium]